MSEEAKQYQQEAEERIAMLAKRDQRDAELVELAREYSVFMTGLDREGVVHSPGYSREPNLSRNNAEFSFITNGTSRYWDRKAEEDE